MPPRDYISFRYADPPRFITISLTPRYAELLRHAFCFVSHYAVAAWFHIAARFAALMPPLALFFWFSCPLSLLPLFAITTTLFSATIAYYAMLLPLILDTLIGQLSFSRHVSHQPGLPSLPPPCRDTLFWMKVTPRWCHLLRRQLVWCFVISPFTPSLMLRHFAASLYHYYFLGFHLLIEYLTPLIRWIDTLLWHCRRHFTYVWCFDRF